MLAKMSLAVLTLMTYAQNTGAQGVQPSLQIVAQAYDRCMATYAVRLTKTPASDEAIYTEATQLCQPLNNQVVEMVRAQVPPPDADKLIASMATSAKPNFFNMLSHIRSDRAKRESAPTGQ